MRSPAFLPKADFDPSKFHDRYEEALIEMIERKKAGLPAEARRPVSAGGGGGHGPVWVEGAE